MLNEQVSGSAVDLIEQILRFNPKDRISIAEIVQHPWSIEMAECIECNLSLRVSHFDLN